MRFAINGKQKDTVESVGSERFRGSFALAFIQFQLFLQLFDDSVLLLIGLSQLALPPPLHLFRQFLLLTLLPILFLLQLVLSSFRTRRFDISRLWIGALGIQNKFARNFLLLLVILRSARLLFLSLLFAYFLSRFLHRLFLLELFFSFHYYDRLRFSRLIMDSDRRKMRY